MDSETREVSFDKCQSLSLTFFPFPSAPGVFNDRRRWIPLRSGAPPRSAVETVLGKPCSPNLQQLRDKDPHNLKFSCQLTEFFL